MSAIDRLATRAPSILGTTRTLFGILFACHGTQKLLLSAFGPLPPSAPTGIVWAAG